jgi:hypothetical protein
VEDELRSAKARCSVKKHSPWRAIQQGTGTV